MDVDIKNYKELKEIEAKEAWLRIQKNRLFSLTPQTICFRGSYKENKKIRAKQDKKRRAKIVL